MTSPISDSNDRGEPPAGAVTNLPATVVQLLARHPVPKRSAQHGHWSRDRTVP